jgi:hypothetical protein
VQETKPANEFSVYPNPAKNILNIKNSGTAIISVMDQAGKILITKTIRGNDKINTSQLAAGLYYLKNNSTGALQKIIITK